MGVKLQRKYYSVEEAAEVVDQSCSDLWHFIESGQLHPCLLSPKRTYIVTTWDKLAQEWVGHATCTYRGLLQVHENFLARIVDQGEVQLSGPGRPLDRSAITGWNAGSPYKNELPSPIQEWRGQCEEELADEYYLIPYSEVKSSPLEFVATIAGFIYQAQEIRKVSGTYENVTEKMSESYKPVEHFDLSVNGTFTREDLRLSIHDVKKLSGASKTLDNASEKLITVARTSMSPMKYPVLPDKLSKSQLHILFYRVLHFGVSTKAQDIWNQIRQDSELEKGKRKFDEESILVSVSSEMILWRSRHDRTGMDQKFARDSLSTTLSGIRKWEAPNLDLDENSDSN